MKTYFNLLKTAWLIFCAALLIVTLDGCITPKLPAPPAAPAASHWWQTIPAAQTMINPATAKPAPANPIKSAFNYLLVLTWIFGLLAIAGGVAFIVWLGNPYLGAKLIAAGVAGIVLATWIAVHYVFVIVISLIGAVIYFLYEHAAARAAIAAEISKLAGTVKNDLASLENKLTKL